VGHRRFVALELGLKGKDFLNCCGKLVPQAKEHISVKLQSENIVDGFTSKQHCRFLEPKKQNMKSKEKTRLPNPCVVRFARGLHRKRIKISLGVDSGESQYRLCLD